MARPSISDPVRLEIKSWRATGRTIDAIEIAMQETRDAGVVKTEMPGRGSIAKYSKQYDDLPQEKKKLDEFFEWHRLDEYGLPWEASAYVLELWRYALESGVYPLKDTDVALPSVRQVRWWLRVHQADPDLDMSGVLHLAGAFGMRELYHDLLEMPLELVDLGALLAYKPWRDDEHRQTYLKAIKEQRIPFIVGLPIATLSKVITEQPTYRDLFFSEVAGAYMFRASIRLKDEAA